MSARPACSGCSLPAVPPRARSRTGAHVADIEAEVAELRRRGVRFEEYDYPGFTTVDGIVEVEGNYPSKGTRERGGFFRDSEDNMIAIGQSLP